MDLLRWMGKTFARFVALSVAILGAWIFAVNAFGGGDYDEKWVFAWVLASGILGVVGGVVYLLSMDGPARFHTGRHRRVGWMCMLGAVLLPTSLTLMLVPMVLALIPSLFIIASVDKDEPVTST